MGDAGEGLVDAEGRIQERMEELARARDARRRQVVRNPAAVNRVESLRLARADLQRQHDATEHEGLRASRAVALVDLDRQLAEAQAALDKPSA
jgi:hypothetical protein